MYHLALILSFFFVAFTDKGGSNQLALSPDAQSLRVHRGIAIDSLDYAVCPAYLDSLQNRGARICHTSRWINGATVYCHKAQIDNITMLPFVKSVQLTRGLEEYLEEINAEQKKRGKLFAPCEDEQPDYTQQQRRINLLPLHELGYKGQGVKVAVIDGGFWNLSTAVAFDSIRNNGQLLGTFDFAEDEEDFEGTAGEHGAVCLSLIGANTENYRGTATKASFYAIKSEENGIESLKEVDNLVAALEVCDSLGVWIASISLGYAEFDEPLAEYSFADLDGRRIRSSLAAVIAARKGMLLCVAAGNSGATQSWPWISSPADADSILTVGAIEYDSTAATFSSIGPTADERIKPELCAVGKNTCLLNVKSNTIYYGNGTSFAAPQIAGLAACLWSAYPEESNLQIRERIIYSCNQWSSPDKKTGYGIPDAWKAYANKPEAIEPLETGSKGARKILRHGRILIVRDGVEYDMLGNKL